MKSQDHSQVGHGNQPKTQTFTSDLFNKKVTSAVRINASNPQPLDSSKI